VKLWDVATGKELKTLTGHQYVVNSVSFSPDGKTLASASGDKTVKLWDVSTGKELKTLNGHQEAVSSVSFSPDGKTLASASWDNTVILWNFDLDKLMQSGCTWIGAYLGSHPEETELQQICQPYLTGKGAVK
jgi:WD40 repeat protein